MSAIVTSTQTQFWPADVLEFAQKNDLSAYLEPLREALERLFPTRTRMKVRLDLDPELRDVWTIVFEVAVSLADVPSWRVAMRRWHDEVRRICPTTVVHFFRLTLDRTP